MALLHSSAVAVFTLSALGCASTFTQSVASGVQVADIVISEDDQNRTIDCNRSAIIVTGNDNRLTLTGECRRLTVDGDDNDINAAAVTEVAISGDDNAIRLETVGKIVTRGDDNSVTWTSGVGNRQPEVSDSGDDNAIRQATK